MVQQQKLIRNDGLTNTNFGLAVAISGDLAIVGAPDDTINNNVRQGSVFVYARNGSIWSLQQKLVAPDGAFDDRFGSAVAISGNTAIVGASLDDAGASANQGSAYVFVQNGSSWGFQQKLMAPDGTFGDMFGNSVAISADTAVIGARNDDPTNQERGSAYVFIRTGASWSLQQKMTAADGESGDHFGAKVVINNDTLAIGALEDDIGSNSDQGSAYVYTRNGSTWSLQQKLTAPDGGSQEYFGFAMALDGDTIAVGIQYDTVGTNASQGSVYVFVRNAGAWSLQQKVIAADGTTGDLFGSAVALEGNILAVVASSRSIPPFDRGALYIYSRNGGTWVQQQLLTTEDGYGFNGGSLAMGGGSMIAENINQGAAYVFACSPCPPISLSPVKLANHSTINVSYNQPITATGGVAPYSFTLKTGSLPPGISLSSDGVLSGTPTSLGYYLFSIRTTDSNGCTGVRAYALDIVPPCNPITLFPSTLRDLYVGIFYAESISASGGFGNYTFTVVAGNLPEGLTLPPGNATSTSIRGIPTVPGTYMFTIAAMDGIDCVGTREYTLTIRPPCPNLTITPSYLPPATTNRPYSYTLTQQGGVAPVIWSISAGGLPSGFTLNPDTGTISGTATVASGYSFTINVTDANGCSNSQPYSFSISNSLLFHPLPHPIRLLDTRAGASGCDAPGAMIQGNTTRTQTAAGRICDGLAIPVNALALTGNITTVESGGGYLTLYPSDSPPPFVASSNFAPNQIMNNAFTVGLGNSDGAFKIYVTTDTNLVVDITGYYAPFSDTGLYFHPLPKPVRLLDTRANATTGCFTPNSTLQANSTTSQQGVVTCDGVTIPTGAKALVGNATTVSPQSNGFLTLYPTDASRPLIASSNFQAGQVMNTPFTAGLSQTGQFNIFTAATTELVVDVLGYYSAEANDVNGQGLLFQPISPPTRLLDTRSYISTCFPPANTMIGGTTYLQLSTGSCPNVRPDARAVVGNATVVNVTANGFLTFWPSDAQQPFVATSNYKTGQIFNRHFIVGLGTDGAFKRFASNTTDLVIDLSGYFVP